MAKKYVFTVMLHDGSSFDVIADMVGVLGPSILFSEKVPPDEKEPFGVMNVVEMVDAAKVFRVIRGREYVENYCTREYDGEAVTQQAADTEDQPSILDAAFEAHKALRKVFF